MSGSLASLPTPPGRSYYLRLIGAAIALFVVIGALVFGARSQGHPFAPWIPPTLFITSFGLVQPKPPGAVWRPLPQRLAFALLIGGLSGALLWAIEVWSR
jgi:hypothetical protein